MPVKEFYFMPNIIEITDFLAPELDKLKEGFGLPRG